MVKNMANKGVIKVCALCAFIEKARITCFCKPRPKIDWRPLLKYVTQRGIKAPLLYSVRAFLVPFKFHDERLDVLALGLPLADRLLGKRVKVLLLLVQQRLSLQCIHLFFLVSSDSLFVFDSCLFWLELGELHGALLFLFLFLLLGQLQLFISNLPKLGVLLLFLPLRVALPLAPLNLEGSRTFNGSFHFDFALLLLGIQLIGFVFGFGHLSVEHFLLVVVQGA